MPTKQSMIECRSCGKPTLHVGQTPSHLIHLLLSAATFGAWLIVWIIVHAGTPKPRCTVCGAKNSEHKSFSLSA